MSWVGLLPEAKGSGGDSPEFIFVVDRYCKSIVDCLRPYNILVMLLVPALGDIYGCDMRAAPQLRFGRPRPHLYNNRVSRGFRVQPGVRAALILPACGLAQP
jgi:hypothetical protein